MPIDIASYRRWDGRARPTRLAAVAIAVTMVRRRMRVRLVRTVIWVFTGSASLIAGLFFFLAREGKGPPILRRRLAEFGLDNVNVLALLNRLFGGAVEFWAVLLAAIVGAPLIAEDRRARALPLYFSRPIGHFDYVAGKAAATAFFLALLLILPRVCMYLLDIAFSDAEGVAGDHFGTFVRSCAAGGAGVVVLTAISLGVSSVIERPSYAALLTLGTVGLAAGLGALLAAQVFHDPAWLALSPWACVQRLGMELLQLPERLQFEDRLLRGLSMRWAWTGFWGWSIAGFAVLVARVRRVEVVT